MDARTRSISKNVVLSRTPVQCGFFGGTVLFEITLSKIKRGFSKIRAYYASTTLFYGFAEDRVTSVFPDG